MAVEDFVSPEVGIAVAATALATSPQVRNTVRRGLVYGLAGVLRLGDAVSGAAKGAASTAQNAAANTGEVVQQTTTEARTRSRAKPPTSEGI